jgi:hypothetical protein
MRESSTALVASELILAIGLSKQGLIVALFAAPLGIAIAIYLISGLAWPLYAHIDAWETMMEGSKRHYVDHTPQFSAGLIIRQKEPRNLEAPFDRINSYLTPTELFYIRSHFPTPSLDGASYQLHIDGAVRRPFTLSYEELRSMPSETRVATLECAGNSRVFLVPQVQGAQWELGAVRSVPTWRTMHARSCSKERIAEHPKKKCTRFPRATPTGPSRGLNSCFLR